MSMPTGEIDADYNEATARRCEANLPPVIRSVIMDISSIANRHLGLSTESLYATGVSLIEFCPGQGYTPHDYEIALDGNLERFFSQEGWLPLCAVAEKWGIDIEVAHSFYEDEDGVTIVEWWLGMTIRSSEG